MTTRHLRAAVCAATLTAGLLATGAGCGPTKPSPYKTHVSIQGNPASPLKCQLVLFMHGPAHRQLIATLKATCNFPLATATTTLVIQGRRVGSGAMGWDNISDPKSTSATEEIFLDYYAPCIAGLDYQASASIDALGADGAPVNASESTTPASYSASECIGGG